ncbi:MAG: cytochrome c-type biogenesis protein [Alphaproteobacteria bacterium]
MTRILSVLALLLWVSAAGAVQPDEMLADPAAEARARAVSRDIRCLVCQNQSIDDSDAELARDLRLLVRERIRAGDSDTAIRDFLVARYGEFVLLKPRMSSRTWLLWFGPLLLLAAGAAGLAVYFRRRPAAPATEPTLDAGERDRLARLAGEDRP